MTELIVLYGMPKDPEHFEKYYREVHGPMTGKLYGIGDYNYGRVHAVDGGTGEFFWYWSGTFDSRQAALRGSALLFGMSRLALPAWDQGDGAAQSDSRPDRVWRGRHKSEGELVPSVLPRGTSRSKLRSSFLIFWNSMEHHRPGAVRPGKGAT